MKARTDVINGKVFVNIDAENEYEQTMLYLFAAQIHESASDVILMIYALEYNTGNGVPGIRLGTGQPNEQHRRIR